MKRYLYLTANPEALIISMLPPEEFGNYLAVGTKKRTRGQAIFFEIDQELVSEQLPADYIEKRCVPHEDGRPKASVYLSIYRVMESIPLKAFKNLYLTTNDGRVLELEKAKYVEIDEEGALHLYQELCPVTPRIASSLPPSKFLNRMTGETKYVSIPKLFFVELKLNGLANDPRNASASDLPYPNIDHLRDCLIGLKYHEKEKLVKTVIRFFQGDFLFRTCKNGFFLGAAGEDMLFYPFPAIDDLERDYYAWWRSATSLNF